MSAKNSHSPLWLLTLILTTVLASFTLHAETAIADDVKDTEISDVAEQISFYGHRGINLQYKHEPHDSSDSISEESTNQTDLNLKNKHNFEVFPIEPINTDEDFEAIDAADKPPLTTIEPITFSVDKFVVFKQATKRQTKQVLLSRTDRLLAKKAKYYIDRNWNKKTGLIDSVQGYHHTTLWDVGSGIGAVLALNYLNEISDLEADNKLGKTLSTLIKMPLYHNLLPNREYNTTTGKPSGRGSETSSNGNGWSALDIGRLLIWLNITEQYKPHFKPQIDKIRDKWAIEKAIYKQNLYGELKTTKRRIYRQEGRLGYLQYAAKGYEFEGHDVRDILSKTMTRKVTVNKIPLVIDTRNVPFFTSDSYLLYAIEIGESTHWWNQIDNLYQLHKIKNKNEENNKIWVFAEDAMNRKPWFAYNNIYYQTSAWRSTTSQGKVIENPQVFSNKAAFAFSVIYDDEFSQKLSDEVLKRSLSQRSIPTGVYFNDKVNTAFNINTNSLILVSLWYKSRNKSPILQGPIFDSGMTSIHASKHVK